MSKKSAIIVPDGHYIKTPDGCVYTEGVFTSAFFSRYTEVFEDVYVAGRVTEASFFPEGKKRADCNGVRFLPLPAGRGLTGFVKNAMKTHKLLKHYLAEYGNCAILRVPGVVGNQAFSICDKLGKPYALEVVVDPWEYFARGANGGIARPVVQRVWTNGLKDQCMRAPGVSYVTEHYLQEKYPCRALNGEVGCFTSSYSSVELPDESFGAPRTDFRMNELRICHAANNFNGNAKGHITLLKTTELLCRRGYSISVKFIGDGPSRGEYERYIREHDLSEIVSFTGRLPDGSAVREAMRESDLFVFPTMAEGLPRVLLEAMAEGLPCISSPVCGIPEILDKENLIGFDDPQAYANRIEELLCNPNELIQMSFRNLEVAKRFSRSELQQRRIGFYKKLASLSL